MAEVRKKGRRCKTLIGKKTPYSRVELDAIGGKDEYSRDFYNAKYRQPTKEEAEIINQTHRNMMRKMNGR